MADKKLTIVARIKAKEGMEETVRKELLVLVAPTRAEPGCIKYDLHQSKKDKGLFMFYENWRSKEDLDEHLQKPNLKAFFGRAAELLGEPVDISFWEMIG